MDSFIVDTHCHLYLSEFSQDIKETIQRGEKEGITKFFMPAIDSNTTIDLLALEELYTGECYAMMGIHPCSVKENYEEELRLVENWFQKRKFSAVGEIGLDFYWNRSFEKEQERAFHQQIEWALHYEFPIVIHSRNALDECINIVETHQNGKLKGIFHCFSGTYEQAMKITDAGLYLGIGGVITYKNAGLAEVISKIPLEHLVLETDSPYLAPVPFRGKRNESSYLRFVIEKLTQIKDTTREEVVRITTINAQKIFGF